MRFEIWHALQMDFETTILTRFDMMFLVKAIPFSLQHAVRLFLFVAPEHRHPSLQDVRDEEKDYTLAMHLIGLHNEGKQEDPRRHFLHIY